MREWVGVKIQVDHDVKVENRNLLATRIGTE